MALDDLGIRRPSLDDVFLALTGHAAGPDHEGTTDPDGTTGRTVAKAGLDG